MAVFGNVRSDLDNTESKKTAANKIRRSSSGCSYFSPVGRKRSESGIFTIK